ncbi:MAG TPA: c-type cytochrome [Steroidobacteraceae bacterium]|nr:c-type cytochrome [Steroidobacteraceae bacterium]
MALCVLLALAACQREQRDLQKPAEQSAPPAQTAVNTLVGGQTDLAMRARQQKDFGENAYQISQGLTLYGAFNCYGCHAWGGGDIGPPLMDEQWIYGGEIDQIYQSIAQGRANGMPAFAGKISPDQIWQISAFVRSMQGAADKAASPGRDDHLRTPNAQEAHSAPPRAGERED